MEVGRYDYAEQFGDDLEPLLDGLRVMLLNGDYVLSKEVTRFEVAFAAFLGVRHVRGVNSGTDALVLALSSLGLHKESEVITQANGFYATVAAIIFAGAKPVLVDADEESFLIDESQVLGAINSRTSAIVPVHLYGKPTPMLRLMSVSRAKNIDVIEDAAQAHGAMIHDRKVGSFGLAGCFSFHPSKNLAAAGDGGAIASNSSEMAEAVQLRRNLGQKRQNEHIILGMNSKLDGIQAYILSAKLNKLQAWVDARNKIASDYRRELSGLPISFQAHEANERHAYHLFVIRTEKRDDLLDALQSKGVDAVVRYPTPIHLQPAFKDFGWRKGQFPVAERLSRELLCLPIRPGMLSDEVSFVCESVRGFFSKSASNRKISSDA